MKKLKNVIDRLPFDNKLVVSGITGVVTYGLTYLATKAGLNLDAEVIPPWTVAAIIATVAAGVAGWFASNEGTVLRNAEEHDGNPDPGLVELHGLRE